MNAARPRVLKVVTDTARAGGARQEEQDVESTTQGRTGPLAGCSWWNSARSSPAFAGRLLGDMGARVIKIEDQGARPAAHLGQGERDGRRHF